MTRPWRRVFVLVLALCTLTTTAPSTSFAQGGRFTATPADRDFAGLVDVGGRGLFLECKGTGSPTVLLEAGYRSPATVWTDDLVQPEAPRTMVLPGVAAFTRVCTYERPGTDSFDNGAIQRSRSDVLPMPRTAGQLVDELHTLLLERHSQLLAGAQMNRSDPRRFLLVGREAPVADREGGAGRWSIDHLFLDQDAIPTLIEVKRSSDTRIRREVVGQMLDYAANGVRYWAADQLQALFERSCAKAGVEPSDVLASVIGEGGAVAHPRAASLANQSYE
jgi:hypothetical protein